MNRWIFFLFLPLYLTAHQYYGSVPPDFSAKVSKQSTNLTLEDFGILELEIKCPKDFKVSDIDVKDLSTDSEIHYFSADLSEPMEEENLIKQNLSIRYEPQVEGTHHLDLPLIYFESKVNSVQKHTLYPPSIECEVRMAEEDPLEELEVASPLTLDATPPVELNAYNKKVFFQNSENDIKDVHHRFLNQAPSMSWKWFVGAFVIALVVYKLYQLVTRKRTLKNLFSRQENPKEKALKALKNLREKNLPDKGQYEDFYIEITQIVRHYIEGHYRVKAPEQTTQEFLQVVLGKTLFDDTINHYLTEFLKFADLVKFARLHPQVQDCSQAEEAAESFILSEPEK
ncbi:MAG: hypothetical protein S4CHLAM7_09850 [Chlamydiae bacterium]|nr:hypothetical protein [Chlamydiota bacterium]